jgi:hypothetical protein
MSGLPNNKMQRTKHGSGEASPLILVFDRRKPPHWLLRLGPAFLALWSAERAS